MHQSTRRLCAIGAGSLLLASLVGCNKKSEQSNQGASPQNPASNAKAETSVPAHIRALAFEKSNFATPITLDLLPQDSREEMIRRRNEPPATGLRPVFLTGIRNSPNIEWFFSRNGLASIEDVVIRYPMDPEWQKFFFYKEPLRKFIIPSPEPGFAFNKNFTIAIAKRKLQSIDYSNAYEGTLPMAGVKMKFHAITFTYRIEPLLPWFPPVSDTFNGKAKALLDPDDGIWKLESFTLGDSGEHMFTNYIERLYAVERMKEIAAEVRVAAQNHEWDKMKTRAREALSIKNNDPGMESIEKYAEKRMNIEANFYNVRRNADQGNPKAQNVVAWEMATSPNPSMLYGAKAVEYATKAIEQDRRNWSLRDTLAAAYARNKQFDRAVETQQEAIKFLERENGVGGAERQANLSELNERLGKYQRSQPYTETLFKEVGVFHARILPAEDPVTGNSIAVTSEAVNEAVAILKRRLANVGPSQPNITISKNAQITIEMPGLDVERLDDVRMRIQKLGALDVRAVHPDSQSLIQAIDARQKIVDPAWTILPNLSQQRSEKPEPRLLVQRVPGVPGKDIQSAEATKSSYIAIQFNKQGTEKLLELTKDMSPLIGKGRYAIVVDHQILTEKQLVIEDGYCVIFGKYSAQEADSLASVILNPLKNRVLIEKE